MEVRGEGCSSRLKGWRWRLRGCSLRLRCSLRWRLKVEGLEVC